MKQPGLYRDCKLVITWEELLEKELVSVCDNELVTQYDDEEDVNYADKELDGELVIASGVEILGVDAFCALSKLEDVKLPDTLTTIKRGAFATTDLARIIIPDNVTSIGDSAFFACHFEYLHLPNCLQQIVDHSPWDASYTHIIEFKGITYNSWKEFNDAYKKNMEDSIDELIEKYTFKDINKAYKQSNALEIKPVL